MIAAFAELASAVRMIAVASVLSTIALWLIAVSAVVSAADQIQRK